MGICRFFGKWIGRRKDVAPLPPDEAKKLVDNYRRVAATHQLVILYPVSDSQIVEVRQRVIRAFRRAAKGRKETLSARHADLIALKFLLLYEMLGEYAMNEHLKYEVRHYSRHGLRVEYDREPPMP
jgi:hypothetical protein